MAEAKHTDNETVLIGVIADIRAVTGLRDKPMLSELAGEIGARFKAQAGLIAQCQKLLSDLTNGDREFQKQVSSQQIWARAVELEISCRAALSKAGITP